MKVHWNDQAIHVLSTPNGELPGSKPLLMYPGSFDNLTALLFYDLFVAITADFNISVPLTSLSPLA